MYHYSFKIGSCVSIKTPNVSNLNEIKKTFEQSADCIKTHFEYPNGLILDIKQTAELIEWTTNKRIILLEDGSLGFED